MSDDSAECPLWGGLSADVSGRSSGPGETADVRLGLIAGDIRRGTPGADTGQLPAMQVSEAARPRGHRVVVQLSDRVADLVGGLGFCIQGIRRPDGERALPGGERPCSVDAVMVTQPRAAGWKRVPLGSRTIPWSSR